MPYESRHCIRRIDFVILGVKILGALALVVVTVNDEPEQMWAAESLRR